LPPPPEAAQFLSRFLHEQGESLTDEQFQDDVLRKVSRTFALTIPQLPAPLCRVVGNAYLLCRIADTIEDEPALTAEQKRRSLQLFVAVVEGRRSPEEFASELLPLLSESTMPAEEELVRNVARVVRVTHGFLPAQRSVLARSVAIMANGMASCQAETDGNGLKDMKEVDTYCYYVAGVVGEMLTELFCDYSPEINKNKTTLMRLAVSFGQGLQLTNILKDVWEDRSRGACWLPRDVFEEVHLHPGDLSGRDSASFRLRLDELIGVARGHLENALTYTLMIPRRERGIRLFCLWALGMAALTLRNISRNPGYQSGREVKISRRTVRTVMVATRLSSRSNLLLRSLFGLAAMDLPRPPRASAPGRLTRSGSVPTASAVRSGSE